MSGDPLRGFSRDGKQGFNVNETKRGSIAPGPGLILEWAGEGCCEERTLLADILSDNRFDVAASQLVHGSFAGSYLVSPFVEMKLALSRDEESERTLGSKCCRRAGEKQAARVKA